MYLHIYVIDTNTYILYIMSYIIFQHGESTLYNYITIIYLSYVVKAFDRRSIVSCPIFFLSGSYPIPMLKRGEDQHSPQLSGSNLNSEYVAYPFLFSFSLVF